RAAPAPRPCRCCHRPSLPCSVAPIGAHHHLLPPCRAHAARRPQSAGVASPLLAVLTSAASARPTTWPYPLPSSRTHFPSSILLSLSRPQEPNKLLRPIRTTPATILKSPPPEPSSPSQLPLQCRTSLQLDLLVVLSNEQAAAANTLHRTAGEPGFASAQGKLPPGAASTTTSDLLPLHQATAACTPMTLLPMMSPFLAYHPFDEMHQPVSSPISTPRCLCRGCLHSCSAWWSCLLYDVISVGSI
ncbi:unnamed protein product, partial [Urochloa humidicola]